MNSLLKEFQTEELKIQSLVLPNRPLRTPEEWQFEIRKRLSDLRLGLKDY